MNSEMRSPEFNHLERREEVGAEYATVDEVLEALEGLSDDDHVKLSVIARAFFNRRRLGGVGMEPCDLIQEAVLATLKSDGKRWNKRIPFLKHLDRAMENISGHWIAKRTRENKHATVVPFDDGFGHTRDDTRAPSTDYTGYSKIEESEKVEEVVAVLGDDHEAVELLMCKAEGYQAKDIRAKLHLTTTRYETILKRIRRQFANSRYCKKGETV